MVSKTAPAAPRRPIGNRMEDDLATTSSRFLIPPGTAGKPLPHLSFAAPPPVD